MSNNKNYKEIVEKRKASILKKREAKVAKKQAILERLDSDIDYLNKVRKAVEKRKDTISKKQFIKDLLNAGANYNEEKENQTVTDKSVKTRERKKYEKGIKDALEAFKVVSFYDNLYYELRVEGGGTINVPNIPIIKSLIENELRKQIEQNNSKNKLSGFVTIDVTFLVGNGDEQTTEKQKRFFNSDTSSFVSSKMIGGFINNLVSSFENFLEEAKNSSDCTLESIDKMSIKTAKSKAIIGGSYIELPDFIKNKKACVNIKNNDDKCFIWCILAYFHYNKEVKGGCKNLASSYKKFMSEIKEPANFSYPVELDMIPEFEELNDLKINIFELLDDNSVKVLYNSYEKKYKNVVNLLLIHDNNENYHYRFFSLYAKQRLKTLPGKISRYKQLNAIATNARGS
jgi:hypothetical protein